MRRAGLWRLELISPRRSLRQGSGQVVVGGGELVGELVVAALEGGVALGDEDALVGVAMPSTSTQRPKRSSSCGRSSPSSGFMVPMR